MRMKERGRCHGLGFRVWVIAWWHHTALEQPNPEQITADPAAVVSRLAPASARSRGVCGVSPTANAPAQASGVFRGVLSRWPSHERLRNMPGRCHRRIWYRKSVTAALSHSFRSKVLTGLARKKSLRSANGANRVFVTRVSRRHLDGPDRLSDRRVVDRVVLELAPEAAPVDVVQNAEGFFLKHREEIDGVAVVLARDTVPLASAVQR
mmetsp:Transcript_2923/g.5777  ORF Transcript_2923/g.5777 Transcript_2923/m.5777 type:complete len:208 (+) Transcript_2923:132-755(+)